MNRKEDNRLYPLAGDFERERAQLLKKKKELEELIALLSKQAQDYLPGTLQVNGIQDNRYFYYRSTENKKKKYISKKDMDQIRQLAQQDYEIALLKKAKIQLSALDRSLAILPDNGLSDIYTSLSECRSELVKPWVPDREKYIQEWLSVKYPPGKFSEDDVEIYSELGERVRSKSEKIIADKYLRIRKPYRYEFPIVLMVNGQPKVFRPDFLVMNPRTLKCYYHQHLGRMDDPKYVADNLEKLRIFQDNGIFLGERLIITTETHDRPLSNHQLDQLIDKYLN